MPEYALWTLVISLIALSIGITIKSTTTSHLLKLADIEINGLITQITILKQDHEKTISTLSQLQKTEKEKLLNAFEKSIDKLIDKMSHSEYSKNTPEKYVNALNRYYKPS